MNAADVSLLKTFPKFIEGFNNFGDVHFMDFEASPDGFEQGNRELAAEVFTKLLQSFEHDQSVVLIHVEQLRRKRLETQLLQKVQNAFGGTGVEEVHPATVNDIHGNTDGNRFTVPEFIVGKLFKLVRNPVAEIEWTSGTEFKRIASQERSAFSSSIRVSLCLGATSDPFEFFTTLSGDI